MWSWMSHSASDWGLRAVEPAMFWVGSGACVKTGEKRIDFTLVLSWCSYILVQAQS